jgi:hypothetical protein
MESKTVRDFKVNGDISAIADAWASGNNFKLRGVDPDGTRRYQRGQGLMVNAQHATLRQSGPDVHLEAWTHATLFDRIAVLGIMPANMAVDGGGFRGRIPRRRAMESVNKLLAQLGQPPLQ